MFNTEPSGYPQFFSTTPTQTFGFASTAPSPFSSSVFPSASSPFDLSTTNSFSPFAQPQQQSFFAPSPFSLPTQSTPTPSWNTHESDRNAPASSSAHENIRVATMNLKDKKNRLLKRCLKKVKDNRNAVLQGLREGTLTPNDVASNLQQLIRSEHSQENMSIESGNKLANLEELEGEEYQEIMTFLEEALFEGLRQEERQLLSEYYEEIKKVEEEIEKENEEAFQHAIESAFDTDESFVLCPVCKKNKLLENHHIIFCACGMRVDTKQDDVDLAYLRTRLCELFQLHGVQCDGELKFSCSTERFGVPSMLFMNCSQCPCNEIVL